jgi:hypothetical protein
MKKEGPDLQRLLKRLAECPPEFLAPPRIGREGEIMAGAVVSDLMLDLGGASLTEAQAQPFEDVKPKDRNRLRLVLVAARVLHDPWFREQKSFAPAAYEFLKAGLDNTAALVSADLFVTDPDRREELVRLCLAGLGLRPRGETEAQAADRLETISSAVRAEVAKSTRAREERARALREIMKAKEAREAAAKYTRE